MLLNTDLSLVSFKEDNQADNCRSEIVSKNESKNSYIVYIYCTYINCTIYL